MKRILPIVAIISLCLVFLAGCSEMNIVKGEGEIQSKAFDFDGFDTVEISNAFNYSIEQSQSYSVKVSAYENIFTYLDIRESTGKLIVQMKPGSYSNSRPEITISMPLLKELSVSGNSRGRIGKFITDKDFKAVISGASQLTLDMESRNIDLEVSGFSKLAGTIKGLDTRINISGASQGELKGSSASTNIEISGASRASMDDLQMANADADISGASQATIFTNGTLNAEVSGASTLEYKGNPTLQDINVTGGSSIVKK